jgi:isoprenylcysteine carboxyl methyltransferase (ICMT) family protein YpbQ
MKKLIKFWKANYKPILKGLILAAALICLYEVLHNTATAQRGYNAIGGEIFIFLAPYLWWAIKKLKEGAKNELD